MKHYTSFGALSSPGTALVTSINTAEQQGTLNAEDGAALYKAAKDTIGGKKSWYLELGIAGAVGLAVGYLYFKM